MVTTDAVIQSRPIQPHIPSKCPRCSTELEFARPDPPPTAGTTLRIACFKCANVMNYVCKGAGSQPAGSGGGTMDNSTPSSSGNGTKRTGRKIGTQENPLETEYYDILGVSVTATMDDIKKAYRRLALKSHPDKNLDDPDAAERFQKIAIAYQTLSDPTLRRRYNEFGSKESTPEGGFVDPEEVFSAIFGGDAFVPLIGELSLGKEMKSALQEAEEAEGEGEEKKRDAKGREILTPEEKAKKEEKALKVSAEKAEARKARIEKLVKELERKLSIFTESATGPNDPDVAGSWRSICQIEAEELKKESYGVELLNAIGYVYASKARYYLSSRQSFMGVGGWFHNVQGKVHVFSETVSTLRSALELKNVFDQIQAAEKAGNLSDEDKKKLEEQAAEKGLRALFKGTKLEIENVLREVCDQVLSNPSVDSRKLYLRAIALKILGDAFTNVKKEEGDEDPEFVRVDVRGGRSKRQSMQP